jgi:uncharacterized protein (DUF488 family)
MSFTLNTSRTCTSKYSATEQQQTINHITVYVILPVSLFVFSVSKSKKINSQTDFYKYNNLKYVRVATLLSNDSAKPFHH